MDSLVLMQEVKGRKVINLCSKGTHPMIDNVTYVRTMRLQLEYDLQK